MNKKNIIIQAIRLVVSVLFIVSAIAKLYPSPYFAISTFEVKQLYPLGFSESSAAYFSRTLIGIEFALGFLILIPHFLKKITIPATIALLLVFIIQLSYETFISGNSGNCGCFGELIPMTPVEAILKNIIAVGLLIWLFKLLPSDKKSNLWLVSTVVLTCILGVYMAAPMKKATTVIDNSEFVIENETEPETVIESLTIPEKTEILATETINKEENKPAEPKSVKSGYAQYFPAIDKGKKILCFFAAGCEHCQETAKQLTQMRKKDKTFPEIYILFMDEEPEKIPDFFKIAGEKYPYQILDIISFWNTLGNSRDTPGVKYLWNGNDYKFFDGISDNQFNADELKKIVKKPLEELK